MDNFNKSFEDRLKDKLENHEFDYEPGQWAGMQQKLQEYQENRWHRYWYWGKRISIGLVAGLVFFTSGWYLREATMDQKAPVQQASQDIAAGQNQDRTYASSAYMEAHGGNASAATTSPNSNNSGTKSAVNSAATQSDNQVDVNSYYSSGQYSRSGSQGMAYSDMSTGGAANYGGRKGRHHNSKHNGYSAQADNYSFLNQHETDNLNAQANSISTSEQEMYASADNSKAMIAEVNMPVLLAANKLSAMPKGRLFVAAKEQQAENTKPLEKARQPHPVSFGMQAGLNMETSPTGPGMESSPSMGFYGEIGLTKRLSLQGAVQLDIQSGKGMHYRSVNVQYGLDRDSSVSNVFIDKVVFIGFPVTLKYKLSDRFDVYGGFKLSSAVSTLASTKRAYYNGEVLDSFNVKLLEIGQMPGVYKYDLSIPFGIECRLSHRVSLAAGYQLGLTDISDNVFFKNDTRHTSNAAQFTVRYRF